MRIIISRTDAIGDVILTLPLAGILKKLIPGCTIIFLGKAYTRSIISLSEHVDFFSDFDEMKSVPKATTALGLLKADCILHVFPRKEIAYAAKEAGIKIRIGTSHRLFHLLSCNKLVNLGRKKSDLHESQLNMVLLSGLGIQSTLPLNSIHEYFGFTKIPLLPERFSNQLDPSRFKIIIHPSSNASAREWPLNSYLQLIKTIDPLKFQIFITGQKQENKVYSNWLQSLPSFVGDLTGQMSLDELIAFIYRCNGLIACSTGPLHIAAALDKYVIGLYPPIRPMHAGRWGALGKHTENVSIKKNCNTCKSTPQSCQCMTEISVSEIAEKMNRIKERYF